MSNFRKNRQKVETRCIKCGKIFNKMVSGSSDISSLSFPVYKIQRYKDYDSLPIEIDLCHNCCDELDRFLLIPEEGTDYFKDLKEKNDE